MAYDRDSFLAGLAVGRTLWRPHSDYGEVPEPWGWDLIDNSESIYNCYEGSMIEPMRYITCIKGYHANHVYSYTPSAYVPSGYIVETSGNRHCTGIFNVFIPARFRTIILDVECSGRSDTGLAASEIYLRDEYGLSGFYPSGFAGNNLKRITLCDINMTSEEINSQPGVTIDSVIPYSLNRQTVVIDVSDINVDMWFGMYRVDCGPTFHSIRAF